MKNYHKPYENMLLISDLDDTLLNSDHKISPQNKRALYEFIVGGGDFTVATGRSLPAVEYLKLPLTLPAILYNGSAIYDTYSGDLLWSRPMQDCYIPLLREVAARFPGIGVLLITLEETYVLAGNEQVEYSRAMEQGNYIPAELSAIDNLPGSHQKFALVWEPERLAVVKRFLDDKTGALPLRAGFTYPIILECMDSGTNKGVALETFSELYGIPLERTVAIGDNLNDVEFLQTAGMGIAVGNAREPVKEAADMVSVCNDDHAVADVIGKIRNKTIQLKRMARFSA